MKTAVKLREKNRMQDVSITSDAKPTITKNILNKWQLIINNVADIFDVPAALIMKITTKNMEVFLRSQNKENPYPDDGKDSLGHGLYCETVIGENRELVVDNSLHYDEWKDNPDVALNMISYLGYPIMWKDGEAFGTICALDSKTNQFDDKYRLFLQLMKSLIEDDLEVLTLQQHLEEISNTDELTGCYNRRFAFGLLEQLFQEYERYKRPFGVMMIDINNFKAINDQLGHREGDKALQEFVSVVQKNIRKVDIFARLGGDEFLLICRETPTDDMNVIGAKINDAIRKNPLFMNKSISISYGVSGSNEGHSVQELLHIADNHMYQMKREQKSTKKSA